MTRLIGRVAVLTSASSGLSRRFAEVLDAAGAASCSPPGRYQNDVELAGQLGDALPVACDVRFATDRQALLAAVLDRYGAVERRSHHQ